MSKGNSFKAQPWTGIDKGASSIFDDDFINDKLTFKFNKKSATSGVQIKQNFQFNKESKIDKYSDELKIWFPVCKNTVYLRLKNNAWKAHLDHGVVETHGHLVNLYGSVQGGRELGSESFKLGLETTKCCLTKNLRVVFKPSEPGLTVYSKTSVKKNQWRFWAVNAFNPVQKTWIHSAFQIANIKDCCSFWLKADASKKWGKVQSKNFLSNITADYVFNYSPTTKLGVEVKANLLADSKIVGASAVYEHKCAEKKNTGVKLKADLSRNLAVSVQNNIEGFGSYIFGINVTDFGQTNRFSYGAQLELNL